MAGARFLFTIITFLDFVKAKDRGKQKAFSSAFSCCVLRFLLDKPAAILYNNSIVSLKWGGMRPKFSSFWGGDYGN